MNKLVKALFSVAIIGIVACGGEDSTGDKKTIAGNGETKDSTANENKGPKIEYGIPTPNEFFNIIKSLSSDVNADILNSPDNVPNYTNKRSQALNFGVYASDLAYISSYGLGAKALKYFDALRAIGENLDINSVFDATVFERVNQNVEKGDSLLSISSETYFEAYAALEENERADVLAMMVIGGWVESMHIVINLVGEYEEGNEIIQRIADQHLTLDNIIQFVKAKTDENPELNDLLEELDNIMAVFSMAQHLEGSEVSIEEEGDIAVIHGGGSVSLNAETFDFLKMAIEQMRSTIISTEI